MKYTINPLTYVWKENIMMGQSLKVNDRAVGHGKEAGNDDEALCLPNGEMCSAEEYSSRNYVEFGDFDYLQSVSAVSSSDESETTDSNSVKDPTDMFKIENQEFLINLYASNDGEPVKERSFSLENLLSSLTVDLLDSDLTDEEVFSDDEEIKELIRYFEIDDELFELRLDVSEERGEWQLRFHHETNSLSSHETHQLKANLTLQCIHADKTEERVKDEKNVDLKRSLSEHTVNEPLIIPQNIDATSADADLIVSLSVQEEVVKAKEVTQFVLNDDIWLQSFFRDSILSIVEGDEDWSIVCDLLENVLNEAIEVETETWKVDLNEFSQDISREITMAAVSQYEHWFSKKLHCFAHRSSSTIVTKALASIKREEQHRESILENFAENIAGDIMRNDVRSVLLKLDTTQTDALVRTDSEENSLNLKSDFYMNEESPSPFRKRNHSITDPMFLRTEGNLSTEEEKTDKIPPKAKSYERYNLFSIKSYTARKGSLHLKLKKRLESDIKHVTTNFDVSTAVDRNGNSCLHKAASNGDISTICYLLKNGADAQRKNFNHNLPIDLSENFRTAYLLSEKMLFYGQKVLDSSLNPSRVLTVL